MFEGHLIWYSLFWLFELEGKALSSILELKVFFNPQYINHNCFQKSTACYCRVTSNLGQNNRSSSCSQGSSHPLIHHSTRRCSSKTHQSQLLFPNRKKKVRYHKPQSPESTLHSCQGPCLLLVMQETGREDQLQVLFS